MVSSALGLASRLPTQPSQRDRLFCRRDLIQHLMVLGETTGHVLGVEKLAVHVNIKDAAMTLDQLAIYPVFVLDFGRQTGGLRLVVSLGAVLDTDVHPASPFRFWVLKTISDRGHHSLRRPVFSIWGRCAARSRIVATLHGRVGPSGLVMCGFNRPALTLQAAWPGRPRRGPG